MKNYLVFLLLLGITACKSFPRGPAASAPFPATSEESLFSSDEPLQVELDAAISSLKNNDSKAMPDKSKRISGQLSYINSENQKVTLPVEVHIKGFSTSVYCSFPKLELKIATKDTAQTYFKDIKTVDLNTHCLDLEDPSPLVPLMKVSYYAHREALLYRMAEVLKIPTLKARPIVITYKNSGIAKATPYQAFFLEDMASLRRRLGAREIKGINDNFNFGKKAKPETEVANLFQDVDSSPKIDREDISRMALFQFMISNPDWYIKMNPSDTRDGDLKIGLWNVKILEMPQGAWVVFPQDFNLSDILQGGVPRAFTQNAWNATDKNSQDKIKKEFLDHKQEIYSLLGTLKMDPEGQRLLKQSLDNFYQVFMSL